MEVNQKFFKPPPQSKGGSLVHKKLRATPRLIMKDRFKFIRLWKILKCGNFADLRIGAVCCAGENPGNDEQAEGWDEDGLVWGMSDPSPADS